MRIDLAELGKFVDDIDKRVREATWHVQRVAAIGGGIAQRLGLQPGDVELQVVPKELEPYQLQVELFTYRLRVRDTWHDLPDIRVFGEEHIRELLQRLMSEEVSP